MHYNKIITRAPEIHSKNIPSCRHYNQIVLDEDMGVGFFCSEKEAQEAGFNLPPIVYENNEIKIVRIVLSLYKKSRLSLEIHYV